MKLFHVSCLVSAANLHTTMCYLEAKHVYNLEVRAYKKNGAAVAGAEGEEIEEGETKKPGQRFETTNREFLYHLIATAGAQGMTNKAMQDAFTEAGRSPKSINNELAFLAKERRVKKSAGRKGLWEART